MFSISEPSKVALFVIGGFHWLEENGYIEATLSGLTPKGCHLFDQLEASGYRPEPDQIEACFNYLSSIGMINCTNSEVENNVIGMLQNWDEIKAHNEANRENNPAD